MSIALLTHKMRIVFNAENYARHSLSPEQIKEEVEMVGFSAELLDIIESNQDDLLKNDYLQSQNSINEIEDIDTIGIVRKKASNLAKKCTLIIEGMTCAACQGSIENHLRSVQGITLASVSLLTHKATVEY